MYIRKVSTGIAAAAVMACSVFAFSTNAFATTADDVAAVAREYGYPESMIQAGYNEYYSNPDKYGSAEFDQAIAYIIASGQYMITTGAQVTDVPTVETTAAPAETPSNQQPAQQTGGEAPAASDGGITLTASDGTTFTRISAEAFINMTYDEKMAYIKTFTPVQQQAIIDNLTPEEYKSLMKQAPTDQKMQIVDKLSEAAEAMGLNIAVDDITDSSLTISMKNDKGELVNVAAAGSATVEDTGYDRRGLLACAAALIGIASSALFLLMRRLRIDGADR